MSIPTQTEVKAVLNDLLKHGNKRLIAEHLNVTEGDVSRRLNPYDERKLSIAEGLIEWRAVCLADPDAGEAFLGYVTTLVESWTGRTSGHSDVAHLVGEVARESSEFICAKIEGKPLAVQRKELLDIIPAAKRCFIGLGLERKAEQISTPRRRVVKARRAG